MNEKKSKAQRAYEALREAAGKIEFLNERELKQIAAAINPLAEKDYPQISIFDCLRWLDASLPPMITRLSSDHITYLHAFKTRLLFFREEMRRGSSGRIVHDVRCVLELKIAPGQGVWLDCETGLPWDPLAGERRNYLTAERRAEIEVAARFASGQARQVLGQIEGEKCISVEWWEDSEADYGNRRRVDELRVRRRPNSRAKFDDGKVIAWKFFPQVITYPEHKPNHYTMQEGQVAA